MLHKDKDSQLLYEVTLIQEELQEILEKASKADQSLTYSNGIMQGSQYKLLF